jgi:aminoglycoside phosphotransferase (APT) family kinase protein
MTDAYSEVPIDITVAQRLLTEQFPNWATLPIHQVASTGTDNAIYRIDNTMAMRLPRFSRVVNGVEKELQWLPTLAPHLPLTIPTVLGKGNPTAYYPWPWSIHKWIDGEAATHAGIANIEDAARTLGNFIQELHAIDTTGAPIAQRGVPLFQQDQGVQAAIINLSTMFNAEALTEAWTETLQAPLWQKPSVWLHGDLHAGNMLIQDERLSAVIDFGMSGIGDPASDLAIAWSFFSGKSRAIFRSTIGVDDATWIRARGWALSVGLIALDYYKHSNPALTQSSIQTIKAVLADAA